jgi:hypothetical protein
MNTEKDGEIVAWIGRIGAAGAEHVMERFAMGRSWAYARLGGLVEAGLLERRTLLYRRPGLYLATTEGLRWQGLRRLGVYRVGAGGFEHARQLATAAVALELGSPGWRVASEREIRLEEADGGRLIASVQVGGVPGGRPALHRPDLALLSPQGRVIAVELELSVKAPRRLAAICRAWARARHIDAVYYLATPTASRGLHRAIAETRAEERITVLPLGDVRALCASEQAELSDARA